MKTTKHKIVIFPTEDVTKIVKHIMWGKDRLLYLEETLPVQDEEKYQHLYIVSTDTPVVGDWCIEPTMGVGQIVKTQIGIDKEEREVFLGRKKMSLGYPWATTENLKGTLQKIIMTTNNLMQTIYWYSSEPMSKEEQLPEIPDNFLKHYCVKGGLDEVELNENLEIQL